jgi:hypothetical protein
MTDASVPAKAQIRILDANGDPDPAHEPITVQFNPETLKVTYANQIVTESNNATANTQDEPRGSGTSAGGGSQSQHAGRASTKLAVQLWFDVTGQLPQGTTPDSPEARDVRKLSERVVRLIEADPETRRPPKIRFTWGTFQFDGVVESLDESLEYFSPEGIPLRSNINLGISQQDFQFTVNEPPAARRNPASSAGLPGGARPGEGPLAVAKAGTPLQAMAAASGKPDWQAIARANGIENPRLLQPGQLIDMNVTPPNIQSMVKMPSVSIAERRFDFRSQMHYADIVQRVEDRARAGIASRSGGGPIGRTGLTAL